MYKTTSELMVTADLRGFPADWMLHWLVISAIIRLIDANLNFMLNYSLSYTHIIAGTIGIAVLLIQSLCVAFIYVKYATEHHGITNGGYGSNMLENCLHWSAVHEASELCN